MNKRALIELSKFEADPPPGVSAWLDEDQTQRSGLLTLHARTLHPALSPAAAVCWSSHWLPVLLRAVLCRGERSIGYAV